MSRTIRDKYRTYSDNQDLPGLCLISVNPEFLTRVLNPVVASPPGGRHATPSGESATEGPAIRVTEHIRYFGSIEIGLPQ